MSLYYKNRNARFFCNFVFPFYSLFFNYSPNCHSCFISELDCCCCSSCLTLVCNLNSCTSPLNLQREKWQRLVVLWSNVSQILLYFTFKSLNVGIFFFFSFLIWTHCLFVEKMEQKKGKKGREMERRLCFTLVFTSFVFLCSSGLGEKKINFTSSKLSRWIRLVELPGLAIVVGV